jgi:hypothetical protein
LQNGCTAVALQLGRGVLGNRIGARATNILAAGYRTVLRGGSIDARQELASSVKRGAVAKLLGFSARGAARRSVPRARSGSRGAPGAQSAEWRISAVLGGPIGACWKEDVGRVGASH